MPKTIADWLAGAILRARLNSRVRQRRPARPSPSLQRSNDVNLTFLDGYKTYIIAIFMVLTGLTQLIGLDIPTFEGQSAGHLLMEGLAIIFLRKGMKAIS
jgi:hypothetical protein